MKKFFKSDLFRSRGFYIALYSCVGVLLLTAVLITYSSLREYGGKENENEIAQEVEFEDSTETSGRGFNVVQEDGMNVELAQIPDDILVMPSTDHLDASRGSATEEEDADTDETPNEDQDEAADNKEEEVPKQEEPETSAPPEEAMYDDEDTAFVSNSFDEGVEEVLADPVFNVYDGQEHMLWPVDGDIVMDYSIDSVIYDLTLDQYRTNDNICIAANAGTQVKATADGVVRTVSNSREDGNYIVIEHGNGWCTTYSQLQDGLLVAEGDVVTAGQVIGGVGNPSLYSVLLGNHLNFKVVKDDTTVNPITILQQ